MMPFSTETGLERVEIVGPDLESSLDRLACSGRGLICKKQETKRIDGGLPVTFPMPKSVLP